jgi:hypothetical protein
MVKLYFGNKDATVTKWISELEEMPIQFSLIEDKKFDSPLLEDENEKAEGAEKITQHIEKLKDFVHQWYECRCDNYPFK